MESILNQLVIPDLSNLIMDYVYPDYKSQFDHVIRDINWGCLKEQLCNGYCSDGLDDETINKLVPKYWIEEFDSVLTEMVGFTDNFGSSRRWFVDLTSYNLN